MFAGMFLFLKMFLVHIHLGKAPCDLWSRQALALPGSALLTVYSCLWLTALSPCVCVCVTQ